MCNFDCSQLLSFVLEEETKELIYNEQLEKVFYKFIENKNILFIKKDYFSKYIDDFDNEYFVELVNEEFIGYMIDDWTNIEHPPAKVIDFIEGVKLFLINNNLKNMRIYICNFAEKGKTEDLYIKSSLSNLQENLFYISIHNSYGDWSENLVIDIDLEL